MKYAAQMAIPDNASARQVAMQRERAVEALPTHGDCAADEAAAGAGVDESAAASAQAPEQAARVEQPVRLRVHVLMNACPLLGHFRICTALLWSAALPEGARVAEPQHSYAISERAQAAGLE